MTTVVTGWHPAAFDLYARTFDETFERHWPKDVELVAYVEEPAATVRAKCRSLSTCDGVREFLQVHSAIPEHCGRSPTPAWKEKERQAGYSFRFDAVKFCKQGFIPENAALCLSDGKIMAWSDADVVTFADVPEDFIEGMLGDDDLIYLGREPKHSEIGFWAVRLNEATRGFLTDFAETYRSGVVFDLPEWHSAFVFDYCRRRFEAEGGRSRNLTPGGRGHVWFESPLGRVCDHLKGNRKIAGRSRERKTA